MSKSDRFEIRVMNQEDVETAVKWAASEGWNPGLSDAECFYPADKNGFLAGFIGNEPVATISCVKYGNKFGFLGFYIVKAEYRKQGYGKRIWDRALEYLGGITVGLDGVVEQQANYTKSGFLFAHKNIRYLSVCDKPEYKNLDNKGILRLPEINDKELAEYDRQHFPAKRPGFLKSWINSANSDVAAFADNNSIKGYGVIRRCLSGYKIGPLFADDMNIALVIFDVLTSGLPAGSQVFLDVPAANFRAEELIKRYNMTPVFETVRMYKGEIPHLPLERIFGITSFELG
jgi:GNAT superfamily N-acetyltransferase